MVRRSERSSAEANRITGGQASSAAHPGAKGKEESEGGRGLEGAVPRPALCAL